jgi:hypothetical protein
LKRHLRVFAGLLWKQSCTSFPSFSDIK